LPGYTPCMSQAQSAIRVANEPDCVRVEFSEKHVIDEVVIRQIGNELTKLVDASPRPRASSTCRPRRSARCSRS